LFLELGLPNDRLAGGRRRRYRWRGHVSWSFGSFWADIKGVACERWREVRSGPWRKFAADTTQGTSQ